MKRTELESSPIYNSAFQGNKILFELKEFLSYWSLFLNLTKRNISVRYKRSILGIFWTLLEPLGSMLIMAVVFSKIINHNIAHYPLYLFSGLIVWNYYSESTNKAMSEIVNNGRLLERVYVPNSVFIFSAVTSSGFNFLLSFGILFIYSIAAGLLNIYMLFIPVAFLLISLFILGISFFLSAFVVFFNDISSIYQIILRLLMYMSAIFYNVDILPESIRTYINLNPTYNMVLLLRDPIYNGQFPPMSNVIYMSIVSVGVFLLGMYIFTKLSDNFAYRN